MQPCHWFDRKGKIYKLKSSINLYGLKLVRTCNKNNKKIHNTYNNKHTLCNERYIWFVFFKDV